MVEFVNFLLHFSWFQDSHLIYQLTEETVPEITRHLGSKSKSLWRVCYVTQFLIEIIGWSKFHKRAYWSHIFVKLEVFGCYWTTRKYLKIKYQTMRWIWLLTELLLILTSVVPGYYMRHVQENSCFPLVVALFWMSHYVKQKTLTFVF